ncbi:DUF2079 domain-containing protein [Planomonospora corallina]|uniref:DUF2079 domain-containing protein n=1 Tax=Planomonospora corallina TaxID=1806052 RepID=A0ABV8I0H4_9ACTN
MSGGVAAGAEETGESGRETPGNGGAGSGAQEGRTGERPAPGGVAGRVTGRAAAFLRRRPHTTVPAVLALVAAAAYAVLGLVKLATFRASTFDLVIVDQAVRGYAGFEMGRVPSVGMHYGVGMDLLQVGDHFSPIYALLAPLYWIHDGPRTLIIAQAVLLALAAIPVWRYAERRLGPVPAHLVAAAYLLSWPVAQTAGFDVHEAAFVPLLSAIMIERFDAGRALPAVLAAAGLLLVKEDMGLLVAGFGVYLLVTRRRLEGTAFVLFGFAALTLVRGVLMPLAGSSGEGFHWAYGRWGDGLGGLVLGIARDPLGALWQLVSPETKVDTLAFLFWPVLLTALLSPLTLAALPLIAERFLADRPQFWEANFHYNAFLVAILFCAGVDGAGRLGGWLRRRAAARRSVAVRGPGRSGGTGPGGGADRGAAVGRGEEHGGGADRGGRTDVARRAGRHWAFGVCAVALTLVPRFALGDLLEWSFYEGESHTAAARQAVAAVPDGVVVEAVNHVGPALTERATVLLWGPAAHGAPWIVADVDRWSFPFGAHEVQRQRVDEALRDGYRVVFERDGYIVLNRPS